MTIITDIKSRIIYNSRGTKSIEIDVISDNKYIGRACAPSGASVGKYEATSFINNKPESSLSEFNNHISKFIGLESNNPQIIYDVLKNIDDSSNYSNIGGSIAYALSIASIESAAKSMNIPFFQVLKKNGPYRFPFPLGNVLGGGAHAGPGTPDIQEFLISPIGAKNIHEAIQINFNIHKEVRKILEKLDNKFTYGRGDEGAWAPNLDNDKAFDVVEMAIKNSGYILRKDVGIGIDFASSSLWSEKNNNYDYNRQGIVRSTEDQINFVNDMIKQYHLIYAEDPVQEEDFKSMSIISKKNPDCIVTGDDMLVTNKVKVEESVKYNSCTGAILKVNQAGSLFEALEFAKECHKNEIKLITSHRSGESIDSHISDIAIAVDSKMIKSGILGGERISKLNQLIRLHEYGLIEGMTDVFTS